MLTPTILALVIAFVILIIFGAYFGGAETAFTAVNLIKIRAMSENGDKRAKTVLYISDHFNQALTTLLIGNNITHIGAGAVATTLVLELWKQGTLGNISEDTASFLYGTVIATFLVFLFAEMIPKSHANDRSETLALKYALSLRILMKVFFPLVFMFTAITKFVSKLFSGKEEPSITEDDLYDIIDTAEEEGVMDEKQSDMFRSALNLSDTFVSDVMTVRDDMVTVDVSMPNDRILAVVKGSNHSRIPVCDGSPEKIVGVLNIRDFLKAYMKNRSVRIRSVMKKPYFAKPDAKIEDIFSDMSKNGHYLAVVGEPGHVVGLATVEDFLEEIVGEIWDEDDVVDKNFIKLGGNRFLVSTELTLGDAFRRMKLRLPDRGLAQTKIYDWVMAGFGHFPKEDETFLYHSLEVSVESLEDNVIDKESGRLDKVVFRLLSNEAHMSSGKEENVK